MYVITHGISSNHWLKTPMTEERSFNAFVKKDFLHKTLGVLPSGEIF